MYSAAEPNEIAQRSKDERSRESASRICGSSSTTKTMRSRASIESIVIPASRASGDLRCVGDALDNFSRADDGTRVVRDVDLESSAHLRVRVTRGRVPHHRYIVSELRGIADRRLHTSVRDESHHDELMDSVSLELQIQVGIGETTGAPMFQRDDIPVARHELAADLTTPRAVLESL